MSNLLQQEHEIAEDKLKQARNLCEEFIYKLVDLDVRFNVKESLYADEMQFIFRTETPFTKSRLALPFAVSSMIWRLKKNQPNNGGETSSGKEGEKNDKA